MEDVKVMTQIRRVYEMEGGERRIIDIDLDGNGHISIWQIIENLDEGRREGICNIPINIARQLGWDITEATD